MFAEETRPWPVATADEITFPSLQAVAGAEVDILVLGCGERFRPAPGDLRAALRDHGVVLEWMDTGAACRTFNVLLIEDRRVAAALIAVGE